MKLLEITPKSRHEIKDAFLTLLLATERLAESNGEYYDSKPDHKSFLIERTQWLQSRIQVLNSFSEWWLENEAPEWSDVLVRTLNSLQKCKSGNSRDWHDLNEEFKDICEHLDLRLRYEAEGCE